MHMCVCVCVCVCHEGRDLLDPYHSISCYHNNLNKTDRVDPPSKHNEQSI